MATHSLVHLLTQRVRHHTQLGMGDVRPQDTEAIYRRSPGVCPPSLTFFHHTLTSTRTDPGRAKVVSQLKVTSFLPLLPTTLSPLSGPPGDVGQRICTWTLWLKV